VDTLVTSFSATGAALYGHRMVASVARYWPTTTRLVVYLDRPMPLLTGEARLTTDLPEWRACCERWRSDRSVRGESTPETPRPKPYHYRYDARRFAVKPFVQRDAARQMGSGVLTWLDGDTVTTRPIPASWAASLLGDAEVAYLGRGSMHPETGYVGFRIPEALPLLEWCCDLYASERFRALPGWTDCHVLRAGLAAVPVRAVDLTSHRYAGRSHIWPVSPLAPYVTHYKGKSKRDAAVKRQAVA